MSYATAENMASSCMRYLEHAFDENPDLFSPKAYQEAIKDAKALERPSEDASEPLRKRWTQEEDNTLIEMRRERYSLRAVGELLGRKVSSCGTRYHILKKKGLI